MPSAIEIWQKYQKNLDFKAMQGLVHNNRGTDQDSLLLFFQELAQQLPQTSPDKEHDAIMLYNILKTEDKRISDQDSHIKRLRYHELFAQFGFQENESVEPIEKPEEPYGLSSDVKKAVYRLALQLFLPGENQSFSCYEINDLKELSYLKEIPRETRQQVFNQFSFLLPYENAIEALSRLSKERPENSAYIIRWLPLMFALAKPIYKEKRDESWRLPSLVGAIFLLKEFFPQDVDTLLEQALPVIQQLSYISQKVLVLHILQNSSPQEMPAVISHINIMLRNVVDEEKPDNENLRTQLIKVLRDSIKESKKAVFAIFTFLEGLPGRTAIATLSALNSKRVKMDEEVMDKLVCIAPLLAYINPDYEIKTFLDSSFAANIEELQQTISRLKPLLKSRNMNLETTFSFFNKKITELSTEVDDLIDYWLGAENQTNCVYLLREMERIKLEILIPVLSLGKPFLDTQNLEMVTRTSLLQTIAKFYDQPYGLKRASHLLQGCQDEFEKNAFLKTFLGLTVSEQEEIFNAISPLLDRFPLGEEKIAILRILIEFPPNYQPKMLEAILHWVEGVQDLSGKLYIIEAFKEIPKENLEQRIIYLQYLKKPEDDNWLIIGAHIKTIAGIDHEVYENILSRLKPVILEQRMLLEATTHFSMILDRKVLQKMSASREEKREKALGFFGKIKQGDLASLDREGFRNILEFLEDLPSMEREQDLCANSALRF